MIARAHVEEARASAGFRGAGQASGDTILQALKELLGGDDDVVFRDFALGGGGPTATVVFVDGLVNKEDVEERIIVPLVNLGAGQGAPKRAGGTKPASLKKLVNQAITASSTKVAAGLDEVLIDVLEGNTAVLVKGLPGAIVVRNPEFKGRPVEKPAVEFALRGPRDSFTETLRRNIALVRRRLADPALRVKKLEIGRRSKTGVALMYLEGVVHPGIVREVEQRLNKIDIDGILDSGYVEQLIEDVWWSPFPTVDGSERPDVVASSILEGRVAILVDNSPQALIVPVNFDSFFHAPEESYERWIPAFFLRGVRLVGTMIALIFPALYVATASFSPGLIPTKLALKFASSREGVALPVVLEALIALVMLELLKEAGFRLPPPVGQIFGVVGGLVLGELGVRGGVFSDIMMVVVSVTAVASFAIVTIALGTVIRLLSIVLMLVSAVFGLYGLVLGVMAILVHLVVMKSFGVPYLTPYPYFSSQDWKDIFVIYPLQHFRRRPSFLAPRDAVMQRAPAGYGGEPRRSDRP